MVLMIYVFNILKAHGPDDICIGMIKICDSALAKPFSPIFRKLSHLYSFLNNRFQCVILNGHSSNWLLVQAG